METKLKSEKSHNVLVHELSIGIFIKWYNHACESFQWLWWACALYVRLPKQNRPHMQYLKVPSSSPSPAYYSNKIMFFKVTSKHAHQRIIFSLKDTPLWIKEQKNRNYSWTLKRNKIFNACACWPVLQRVAWRTYWNSVINLRPVWWCSYSFGSSAVRLACLHIYTPYS